MQEIICRFAKGEKVKWVSHLETMRMLERALRRAEIPVTYTQGYNPRPKIALGPALPAGMTSEAELVALFLERRIDPEQLQERLNRQLPPGFMLVAAWSLPAHKKKQTLGEIDTAEFVATLQGPADAEELQRRVVGLLSCEEIPFVRRREKKTQELDLRRFILALSVEEAANGARLTMVLRTGSGGGARPQEVLEQLAVSGPEWKISLHRKALYADRGKQQSKSRGILRRGLHNSLNRQRRERNNRI